MPSKAAFNHPAEKTEDSKSSPGQQPRKGKAAARYQQLASSRAPYLDRARECSKLTLPYLIPPDASTSGQRLPTPYQSVGANGVTNLAAKLLLTMLPPNEPCFRLRIDNLMEEKAQEETDKEFRSKIERALSRVEQAVLGDIEAKGDRAIVHEGNLHLLIGGNVLYCDDPKDGLRLFPLSRFVIDRAPNGIPVEIITEEVVHLSGLDSKLAQNLREARNQDQHDRRKPDDEECTIYTHLERQSDKWIIYQECEGLEIPDSRGNYKLESCPWIPVRMYHIPGEAYGRSYVENYLGDLKSLEALYQAVVEASAISAKVVFFVSPNGNTSARAVTEANNGDVLEGDANEVTTLQVQKGADLRVTHETIGDLINRLSANFLLLDGSRRDAERVTAEEIRAVARELEAGLGGVYTVISQEFQLPFIRCRMAEMTKQNRLPKLPGNLVKPSVVTGFDALGRGNDKLKLLEFLGAAKDLLGEVALGLLNPSNALMRLASSIGLPTEGLLKSSEEMAQEQQQAQAMQAMQSLGPEAIKQIGGMAQKGMNPSAIQQIPQGAMNGSP